MSRQLMLLAIVVVLVFGSPARAYGADPNAAGKEPGTNTSQVQGGAGVAAQLHDTFEPGDVFIGANGGKVGNSRPKRPWS